MEVIKLFKMGVHPFPALTLAKLLATLLKPIQACTADSYFF